MKTMKAASLVLDFDFYPRNNINSHNIRLIAEAMAIGEEMPPIIIDKKSKRVVDGFHRVKAALRTGPDTKITVAEKTYKNDAAMFADAMRLNAIHGLQLDSCDKTRCAIIGEKLGMSLTIIAAALHMTTDKLGTLHTGSTAKSSTGMTTIPLKRTNRHMAGKKLTKKQEKANERSTGLNQQTYANQLIELIESGLLNKSDDRLMVRLQVLHGLLDDILAVH